MKIKRITPLSTRRPSAPKGPVRRSIVLAALALPLLPGAARAQAAIEELFSKTEAVTVSGNLGCLTGSGVSTGSGGCGLYGFGLEAVINLATPEGSGWGFELALGYGQLSGFRAEDPGLDLRGAVRALPSVAAYASRGHAMPMGFDQFYFGLHTGFLQTVNLQAYDLEGRQFSLKGETFEFGVSAGLFHGSGLFLEPTYRFRHFPSVEWTLPESVEALPAGWPRSLDLSGPSVSVGYQFSMPSGG